MEKKFFRKFLITIFIILMSSKVYANEVKEFDEALKNKEVRQNSDIIESYSDIKEIEKSKEKTQELKKVQTNAEDSMVIENGFYIIKSALDMNKVIDIDNVSKNNEANIQLWSKNQGTNQIFELIYEKNTKTYKIKSALSGKVFDLYDSGKISGTNVQLYDDNNVNWQKWQISKTIDGYYSIKSFYSGLYLDVTANRTLNGTNIEVYTGNDGKNQKFIFEKVIIPQNNISIDNGFYQIKSVSNFSNVMDVLEASKVDKADIGMYQNNMNANQRFIIERNGSGFYWIKNLNSNLYMEADGLQIKQRKKDTKTMAQDWALEDAGNGNYYVRSRCGGLYLKFDGNINLGLAPKDGKKTQMFRFEKKACNVGQRSIEDGYYFIGTLLNKTKVIDIEGESIKAEANALLWSKNNRNNQKFKVTYDGKGYYTITSVKSNKVLDVAYAALDNESNVQQYYSSDSNWQKWIIEKNEDGSYSIISAHNGLYIDIPYERASDGNNIQLYAGNGGKNQKFVFEKAEVVESKKTIADGYYKIKTKLDKTKVLDIPDFSKKAHTRVALWQSNGGYNQRFKITYGENGFYTIKAINSGKVLDISNDGINIEQDDVLNTEEQEWVIEPNGEGAYYIISAHNGLYLNVEDTIALDGSRINIAKEFGTTSQEFVLEKVNGEEGSKTVSNGTYQIVTNIDTTKVLDITEASNKSGANLEIWTNNKQNNQKFTVIYQDNGYYKLIALNSEKALGVVEVGNGKVVDVKQYDDTNSPTQDWIIKSCGNGYYNIISACNGLYLNVEKGNISNGANVEVSENKNTNEQKFKFIASKEIKLQSGTYGSSGLKVKGDSRGQNLKYYKIGNGPNVFFATFAIHGWEDCFDFDGKELTKIAEAFKEKLLQMQDESLANKWTIYIFPSLDPDGEYYGYTHNGPGRTTLYSLAPKNKGIDMNRCWSTGFKKYTGDRNYNGTEPFQAYEARELRDFLLSHKSENGQTILVDLHGWLNETIGDNEIGSYYRTQFGMNKHISTYGQGYLVNWARSNLGSNGKTARSSLVELPEVSNSNEVLSWGFANKYINATLNMLRGL